GGRGQFGLEPESPLTTHRTDNGVTLATSTRESGVTTGLRTREGAQHGFQFSGDYPIDADLAGWIGTLGLIP
ncbi:hypothetical protein DL991_22850, partial [Amycolatopsis sp. WAC 01375]